MPRPREREPIRVDEHGAVGAGQHRVDPEPEAARRGHRLETRALVTSLGGGRIDDASDVSEGVVGDTPRRDVGGLHEVAVQPERTRTGERTHQGIGLGEALEAERQGRERGGDVLGSLSGRSPSRRVRIA